MGFVDCCILTKRNVLPLIRNFAKKMRKRDKKKIHISNNLFLIHPLALTFFFFLLYSFYTIPSPFPTFFLLLPFTKHSLPRDHANFRQVSRESQRETRQEPHTGPLVLPTAGPPSEAALMKPWSLPRPRFPRGMRAPVPLRSSGAAPGLEGRGGGGWG